MRQRRPNLSQMAAALALQVPKLVPEHLRDKSALEILRALDFHHDPIPYADGGTCDPQNLTAMLRAEHKEITRKVTVPTIAKNKRIRKKEARHDEAMARKAGTYETDRWVDTLGLGLVRVGTSPRKKREWPNVRPKVKLPSRGFQGHRKFDGTPVWKKKSVKD